MPLVTSVASIVALMVIGFALRRKFNPQFVADLNRLLSRVFLPALVFQSTTTARIDQLGVTSGSFASAVSIVFLFSALISLRIPVSQRGAFIQSCFRGNLVYLGLPVVTATVGTAGLALAAPIIVIGLILHVSISIPLLQATGTSRHGLTWYESVLRIVTNPLVLSAVAGLALAFSGVSMPPVVSQTISLLARAALPLALLIVGWKLPVDAIRANFPLACVATFVKLVCMPAVAWLVASQVFEARPATTAVVVILAGSPTAIMAQSFAEAFDGDARLAAAGVALSTIVSLVTLPIWAAILA